MIAKKKSSNLPLIYSAIYFVVSAIWIFFSDKWVDSIFEPSLQTVVQTYKGWFFVFVTGILYYFSLFRTYKNVQTRDDFYNQLFIEATIGFVEFTDQEIIYSNKVFREVFQFNENTYRLNLTDLVKKESHVEVKRALAYLNQKSEAITIFISPKNGEENWFSLVLSSQLKNDKKHYYGVLTDMQKSRQFEVYTDLILRILVAIDSSTVISESFKNIINVLISYTSAENGMLYVKTDSNLKLVAFTSTAVSELITEEDLELGKSSVNGFYEIVRKDKNLIFIPLKDGNELIGMVILSKQNSILKIEDEISFFKIISNDLGIKLKQKVLAYNRQREEDNKRLLLEYAKVTTWEIDLTTGILKRNSSYRERIDFETHSIDEIKVEDFIELIYEEDQELIKKTIKGISEKKPTFEIEYRVKSIQGGFIWQYSSGTYYFDDFNQRKIINGMSMDIHERKVNEELLRTSEESYRDLFQNNPAPLFIADIDTKMILGVNQAAKFLYGYNEKQFKSMKIYDLNTIKTEAIKSIPRELIDNYGFFRLGLWQNMKQTGEVLYVDVAIAMIHFEGQKAYLFMANEVTNVILSQQALSKSESKYRTLFQENPQPLLIIDPKLELVIDVNDRAIKYFQKKRLALVQQSIQDIFGERVALEIQMMIERLNKDSVVKTETRFWISNENERIIELTAAKTEVEGIVSVILFLFDTTDAKRVEQKAIRAFIEGEDRERERMAKELHDSLGQVLTASSMNLKSAQKELIEIDFKRKEQFLKGVNFLQQAIEETRSIAQNLMPKTITDFGLISSLDLLINSYENTLPFSIILNHNLKEARLNRLLELNVYRIIQEGLTNVIKYAKATQVVIAIELTNGKLNVEINDNGVGMTVSEESVTNGIGLKNMRSRVKIMNGELFIDSIPANGTTIRAVIPISNE